MSSMRYVNTDFWSDAYVVDHLNPLDRYLFIYLFTNPHTNVAGVYELSTRIMSFETGIEREELLRMLKRLEPKVKYVGGWVILQNGIRHQNYHSPKMKISINRWLNNCPPELIEEIHFPEDFDIERPKGSAQTQLITNDLDEIFNDKSADKKTTVDKKPVEKKSTPRSVKYGMHTQSHNNNNNNSNAAVAAVTESAQTAGKKFVEINLLYEDLHDLVDDKFKAWYCKVFFKLGRDRVMILASQARSDSKAKPGGDATRLFSYLLKQQNGVPQGVRP